MSLRRNIPEMNKLKTTHFLEASDHWTMLADLIMDTGLYNTDD